MSTRSNIAIVNENGTVSMVYCHWDGYPENNGALLLQHYRTEEVVRQLIDLGDFSALESDTDEINAYGRNQGERGTEARTYANLEEARDAMQEYLYVWNGDRWVYSDHGEEFQPLTPEVCEISPSMIQPVEVNVEVKISE